MSYPKLPRRFLSVVLLLLGFVALNGQTLSTPPFNPSEPGVLSRRSQGVIERLDTRKWRRRYNQYELIVQVWQIYYARKKGASWKEIFGQVSGLLRAELDQHKAYYDSMSEADAMVSTYYLMDDIRKEFRTILKIGPAIVTATEDPRVWPDVQQVQLLRKAVLEINDQASLTLGFVAVVAGVDVTNWPGAQEAGVEAVEDDYWATTTDRLQQLDRIHGELRTLRILLDNLHRRVQQTTLHRQQSDTERLSTNSIFGLNN